MAATSGYDENELLWDILGPPDYNNLDEPTPWSNQKSTIMGLTITFMVRFQKSITLLVVSLLLTMTLDIASSVVVRLLQIMGAIQSCAISLVG